MAVIGDIYEIDLEKNNKKGYFQYCYKTKTMGYLIRVFRKVYDARPKHISELVEEKDFFWLYFPVESARRQGVIERLGKYNIPESVDIPPYMRTTYFTISDDMVSGALSKGDATVYFRDMPVDDFFALSKEILCNLIVVKDMILKGWCPSKSRF